MYCLHPDYNNRKAGNPIEFTNAPEKGLAAHSVIEI